jgi:hypothetical protein
MRFLVAVCRARWKRASPLARDVTLVLVLKAAALGVLWSLFFSAPQAPRMSVAPDRVERQLLAPAAPAPGAPHGRP